MLTGLSVNLNPESVGDTISARAALPKREGFYAKFS